MQDNEKLLAHVQNLVKIMSVKDYKPTPQEIEHCDKFYEYTFNQIETIIDKYMKAEYIQSDMLSHNMESAYKRECGYKNYWDELVQHLKEFIRELYNGK